MRSKGRNLLFYTLIVAFLVLLGYLRDHLFVHINYQMYKLYYHNDFDYQLPPDMKWLEQFSYRQLYLSKFPLTAIFTALYFLPLWLVVKREFNEKKFRRMALYAYLIPFVLSLLVFATGYTGYYLAGHNSGFSEKTYTIARYIMGYLQSPLLLMILVPAFKISSLREPQQPA